MSDDNVLLMPKQPAPPALLIGPFETWRVQVDGRVIPRLEGLRQKDGRVSLIVDGRFMYDFPDEEVARGAAWLIAQALAIGEGYPHLGAPNKDQPFAPQAMEISTEKP